MTAPHCLIDFIEAGPDGARLRRAFDTPTEVLVAHRLDAVRAVLEAVHARAQRDAWCVGYLRYEAAPAFDRALPAAAADGPLAWFAVFEPSQVRAWPEDEPRAHANLAWQTALTREQFERDVQAIRAAIAAGEVYQVNLTAHWRSRFGGDARALFHALHRTQPDGYAAFIDNGAEQIVSVSPELFFDWRDGVLLSRPMKGTAARGPTPEADQAQAHALVASSKERAENLMIVDLIRNDVSRIAQPHGVSVPRLFTPRALPTVWQMTSDVRARVLAGTTLADVFAALFPCGSVTGAPKIAAMKQILHLERAPRGVYCGAVGVVQPGGAATFNVGIRTLVLRAGTLDCGIGSGITIDSTPAGEWEEWNNKRAFIERVAQPFELLETMRLERGNYPLRAGHLARLQEAARHFGYPYDEARVAQALATVARAHAECAWRVRLLLDAAGVPSAQATAHDDAPPGTRPRVQLAESPIDAPLEFIRYKTTRRAHYQAFAPADTHTFDTLLWNSAGDLTEFTRGNVALKLEGVWYTPPTTCGLLDGVLRRELVRSGQLQERGLARADLQRAQGLAFINALRGWIDVELAAA
jgi:para-aminobenzoate synthetase/4-amino-4-deoxychorismate lyase